MDKNWCTNGIIRVANYTICASVFIHFCMQRKNNENIPYNLITNKKYICKELRIKNTFAKKMPFYFEKFIAMS